MTGRCERCPVRDGVCRAQAEPAYGVFCEMAANGEPSQVAAIRAASAGRLAPPAPGPESVESPRLPLADSLRAVRLGFRNCRHSAPAACSCQSLVFCGYLGRDAVIQDCLACPEVADAAVR